MRGRPAVLAGAVLVIALLLPGLHQCTSGPQGDAVQEPQSQEAPSSAVDEGGEAPVVASGPMPTSFEVAGGQGELVGYAQGPLGVRATWSVASSLEQACAAVLAGYESQGDVELHYSGYLDLLGNTWACLVAGPAWVEVAVVEDGGESGAVGAHSQQGPCTLSVMRLGQEAIGQGQAQDEGEVGG